MDDATSKLYTSFVFLSMTTMVLCKLYRKRKTRIEITHKFWDAFWRYLLAKKEHPQLFEANSKMYNNICHLLNVEKPSYSVNNFLSQMVSKHLKKKSIKQPLLTVLVPLCGCSYDLYYIALLLQTEYKLSPKLFKIIGIESSIIAIKNFFKQNQMTFIQSCYNPKYMKQPGIYRIDVYSSIANSINIIKSDIFNYFDLSKHLQQIGVANTPCLIQQNSIDIIIDINAMSCINPSDRTQYAKAMKYWLKDQGSMLLNTYAYHPKLSNYPPFTIHYKDIHQLFGMHIKYKLLESRHCENGMAHQSICQSWTIQK